MKKQTYAKTVLMIQRTFFIPSEPDRKPIESTEVYEGGVKYEIDGSKKNNYRLSGNTRSRDGLSARVTLDGDDSGVALYIGEMSPINIFLTEEKGECCFVYRDGAMFGLNIIGFEQKFELEGGTLKAEVEFSALGGVIELVKIEIAVLDGEIAETV